MNLLVIGISFRSAPIGLRERVSFTASTAREALTRVMASVGVREAALVSTCNRTELYVVGPDIQEQQDSLLSLLLPEKGAPLDDAMKQHFYTRTNLKALEHLMVVSASLDSMVVGETEILGQVKQAYTLAVEAESCGQVLHAAFQNALRVAKRVHTETDICVGRVSVSSIAVEFAEKIFDDLRKKTVMIIGAGEMGELSLKSLLDRGATQVLVFNRSHERGIRLAAEYGGRAVQFDRLEDHLADADIVISSTSAPHKVVCADAVRRASAQNRGRPMLLIDIANPRDIEEAVGDIENVYLYDIDDLQTVATENLGQRRRAVDRAQTIVQAEVAELSGLFKAHSIKLLMREMDVFAEQIKERQWGLVANKAAFTELGDPAREQVQRLIHKSVNAVLDRPRRALAQAAKQGHGEEYVDTVRALFGFERGEENGSE